MSKEQGPIPPPDTTSPSDETARTGYVGTINDDKALDPNIVHWNGPDDPENPLNWVRSKRVVHIGYVSIFALYANLAATMFAPGADQLAADFHITSSTVATFTVSIYVLGFVVGPLFVAPLSELYGRLILYHICTVFYFAFTAGCAFSTNTAMFLVFRFICGCAAAGPMTIGGGTVADTTSKEKRGVAMALFFSGPLLGPVIGPIIGGFVTQNIGWRWTFRLIMIMSGTLAIPSFFFLRETNAAILLERKAERLRKESGNPSLVSKQGQKQSPSELVRRAIVRPAKMLLFSPIVLLLSLYTGLLFGLVFLLFTTFPGVFEGQYGWSAQISGLAYLGLGIGMVIGLVGFSLFSDKYLQRKQKEGLDKPELRLVSMRLAAPVVPIGCFLYGWTAYYQTQWMVPLIGTFFIGFGALFVMMPTQVYLVDAYGPQAAASALAANLVLRSLFGAFLPLAAPQMYANLGLGWGNSLLGFVCLAFAPLPWLFYRYGEYVRTRFVVDL